MLDAIFIAVTSTCANVSIPEATPEAMRYYNSGNILYVVKTAWAFIVPLLFLIRGFTGKLSKAALFLGRVWFFTILIYLALYFTISTLLEFPLDYYSSYIRPHEYGLSKQTVEKWFENYSLNFLVSLATAFAFIWIFYLLIKKSPKRWWLYSSLVSVGISIFMMLVQPIWIDPLFHTFSSMKDKVLEKQILSLASKAGIENGRVYEVEMSKETSALNAYVTGFGSTNRIVLWDTTIAAMPEDQILFVMGHEMGHYVLHHIEWSLLYFTILSFIIFYLTYKSANFLTRKFHNRFGFTELHNIASFPLLLFLLTFYLFLSTPLSNYVSCYMEHEADRFGLEITQNNEAAARAFLTLQKENLGNPYPGPIYRVWRCDHPPLGERIEFCNSYCPWKQGGHLEYGKYFSTQKETSGY